MNQKRIALIGYDPDYFQTFGQALDEGGFEVFWVHITRDAARAHRAMSCTPPERILDSTAGFRPELSDAERCRNELSQLESASNPRIHDIILMDRILRNKSYRFASCYINHLQQLLSNFLTENSIALVSSGRDSALQLVSMLVCRKLGIPWVVPTRMRIPQNMYMFASGHETASIVDIRPSTDEDRAWAEAFLRSFNTRPEKPAQRQATRTAVDILRMAPRHAKIFFSLLKKSVADRGNDYSRYTTGRILWLYLRRRFNLLLYKAFPPYSAPGDQPFCLYGLHTQPESSIDVAGSYFSDQTALITFISRSLPVGYELYVKIHPSDVGGKSLSFYRKIAALPGVRLIGAEVDSSELLPSASIIFTLTGTIGYEAGLIGRRVVAFANNYFNRMPTVHYCESPRQLPALIDSLLNAKPPEDLKERLITFIAELKSRSFHGEVNRMHEGQALTDRDLKTLREAYDALYVLLAAPKAGASKVAGQEAQVSRAGIRSVVK
jgi:capsular polysaccharide biosynthesis protein